MKTKWIEHKGKKILFINYNGITSQDEMLSVLNEYSSIIKKQSGKTLTLIDSTNASAGPDFVKEAKRLGKENADKLDKTAMLGITGLKSLLLKGYNLFANLDSPAVPFATREEALEYLIS